MWKELSEELSQTAGKAGAKLFHVGGEGLAYRTGLWWTNSLGVTFAQEAQPGDAVQVVDQNGKQTTKVKAFDPETGLVLLEGKAAASGWALSQATLGGLAMTLAYASAEGLEARLDMVRMAASDYLQTDGNPFPGFLGAAVLDHEGGLLGMVSENSQGNLGAALPAAKLSELIERLLKNGSPKTRVLGVRVTALEAEQNGPGLLVLEAELDSPARRAGIQPGDILTAVDSQELKEASDLPKTLALSGGDVVITMKRGGSVMEVKASPAERLETWRRRHHG